ncbi:MAG: hypothetical protein JO345_31440 [Streptosporangiaceae bacterium]|nr:hypothetical protein [Streptosporangiaceae bacterium]
MSYNAAAGYLGDVVDLRRYGRPGDPASSEATGAPVVRDIPYSYDHERNEKNAGVRHRRSS